MSKEICINLYDRIGLDFLCIEKNMMLLKKQLESIEEGHKELKIGKIEEAKGRLELAWLEVKERMEILRELEEDVIYRIVTNQKGR